MSGCGLDFPAVFLDVGESSEHGLRLLQRLQNDEIFQLWHLVHGPYALFLGLGHDRRALSEIGFDRASFYYSVCGGRHIWLRFRGEGLEIAAAAMAKLTMRRPKADLFSTAMPQFPIDRR